MARDIDGGRAIVEVDAALDEKSVKKVGRELKTQLAATDTTFKIDATLSKDSVAGIKRDLKAALSDFDIPIKPTLTKTSVGKLRTTINAALKNAFRINIQLNKTNLATIKAEIKAALREETNVGVRVAAKDLAAIRAAINLAVPKTKTVEVKADLNQLASRLGRIFGRGARNNFFNLFGILIEGAIRGMFALGGAIKTVTEQFQRFGAVAAESFLKGGTAMSSLAAGVAASAINMPQLIATAGVLAAVLAAVSLVAGPLVATLYSLAGAAIAVGTAFTGALVGGSIVALAAMAPLVAIVGSLASAWLLANKQQKDAFKQMIQDAVLDKLKDTILEANDVLVEGLGPSLEKVGDTLANFKPAILGVAESLNILGEEIANSMDSDEFKEFQKVINEELPEDTLKLGRILSDTFGGLGGVFVSLQPAVDKFLDRLGGAMESFNTFANSAEGQQSLSDFFLQAESALGSVGRLIKETGALFATMFKGAAGDEGIELIDSFTGKIRDLTEYIKNNPAAVREFFEGASDIARAAGDAIVDVTKTLGELNTPTNRAIAKTIFKAIGIAAEIAISPIKNFIGFIETGVRTMGAFIQLQGMILKNKEWEEIGRSFANFGKSADSAAIATKFLKGQIEDVKGIGAFKINAETGTIQVGSERAKKLLEEALKLKGIGGIKVKVEDKELTDAEKAAKDTKDAVLQLDGTTATINVDVVSSLFDTSVLRALADLGVMLNASGGIMQGGKQLAGGKMMKMASGGIVSSPTFFGNVLSGEDGPEAIVPLRRSLSRVDPSVRELSAIAQGKGNTKNDVTIVQQFYGPMTSIGQVREADVAYRFATQAR